MAYKTYKIDLTEEQEQFLQDRKNKEGIALNFQLTEAVSMYIERCKEKQDNLRPLMQGLNPSK